MDIFEKALSETGNATCTEITESDIAAVEASIKIGFPLGYRDFLKTKNGFTGWLGANFVSFYALSEIADENYPDWTEFFPNTVRIGDTKALENFVINYDFSPPRFGLLPHIGDKSDFIDLGNNWAGFVRRLADNTIWDKDLIRFVLDGDEVFVTGGTTLATAILNLGNAVFRESINGQPRGPLCGMGICFECRVTIDGLKHQRSCTILAADGMEVTTE